MKGKWYVGLAKVQGGERHAARARLSEPNGGDQRGDPSMGLVGLVDGLSGPIDGLVVFKFINRGCHLSACVNQDFTHTLYTRRTVCPFVLMLAFSPSTIILTIVAI